MSDSISDRIDTIGRITAGSSVTGEIETANDRDAYAVELVAGRTYRIDLEGVATDKGTLVDPFLRWLRDDTGTGVAGTRDDNGGEGDNARQTFTPAQSGTYYISARGLGDGVGTYTLTVTDTTPTPHGTDATSAGATDVVPVRVVDSDLGDITALAGPRFSQGTLDGDGDQVDYYRFTLTEAKKVGLGLRQQDANADLYLEDADGTVLYRSTNSGTADEAIAETLLAGTYYLRVESQEAGYNAHVVRYGVSAPDADAVAALQQPSGTAVNAAPAFAETSYAFDLAENANGSTDRVSLGTVTATDPEGATLSYALVGGNGSFEVDETTGELFYTGTGEDYESETTRFFMAVRASDGSLHAYTSVVVNVTDVNETPAFAETSYAFDLAENTDGSTDRVSLGTVAATDPEGATLAYSLVGGNESGSFEVDAASGELFYKGSGEDFESGTTQFTLTVRASDGSESADTTVTVDVADVNETPAFAETSYAFDLAENADGSTNRVSLGTVAATDPEGATLAYSLVGGNESGSFEVDATSGELFYKGSGEDFESATTQFTLTVRASDGSETADTTVTVDVTDVNEAPTFVETSYAFDLAENADGSTDDRVSLGTVAATDPEGTTLAYSLVDGNESGSFEIDATSGELFYKGSGEDFESGTTRFTLTVRASDGSETTDTTVTVNVTDVNEAPAFGQQGYTFALAENTDGSTNRVSLGTVAATDPEGTTLAYRLAGGNESGSFEVDATSGELFYKGAGEDFESGTTRFTLTVRASDGTETADTTVTVNVTDVNEAPTFVEESYTFNLAENADGSTNRVALGTVAATDPEGVTLAYSLVGNSGSFDIDAATGEIFYTGTGEDFDSGTFHFALTVRASDGTGTTDTTVNVNVTNVNETPAFAETSYAFDLAENADGSTNRVSLGTVAATDPEGATLAYSLAGGNESGSFEIDATSGELFYKGSGEDFESDTTQFTLTVRASDGSETADTTVTVDVTDVEETVEVAPPATEENQTTPQTVSETDGEDFSADTSTSGRIAVGETATGNIGSDSDRDWFAVKLEAGRRYIIDLRGSPTDDGTLGDPYLYGIHNAAGNLIAGTANDDGGYARNSKVTFTATETGTHYIAAGAYPGAPQNRQGTYEVEVSEALPMLRVADAEAAEGDDPDMVFRVTLGSPSPGTVTVDYATADGTATAGEDYTAASGTLTFAPGETEKTVRVAIIDDALPDNGETFTLVLSNPSGVALSDAQATGTILNTEPSVSEPAGEDLPADDTTTGTVALGDPATGEIGTVNDRDWFAVEMVAGVRYRIDIMGSDTGSGTLSDPYFRGLYDSEGNQVGWGRNDGGEGRNSRIFYTPDESGTYYIAAAAGAYRTGTYTVSVGLGDDYSDSTDTTGEVAVGGTAEGEIEVRRDRDWFAVTLAAGEEYRIDLKGDSTDDGTLEDPFLFGVHDSNGSRIDGTMSDNSGETLNSRVLFRPTESGTYYIAAGGYGTETGTYTLAVEATGAPPRADDHPADTETTATIAVGGTAAAGVIENGGDRDWFAVELEAGTRYRINMLGLYGGDGTLEDPKLYGIYDSDGDRVANSALDDGGAARNNRKYFTPDTTGTYYIEAGGAGHHVGAYSVSVGRAWDRVEARARAIPLDATGAGTVTGELENNWGMSIGHVPTDPSAFDWYAVTLEADVRYRFDLTGYWTSDGTLINMAIRGIYDGNGNKFEDTQNGIYSAAGFFENARVHFTPDEAGTYYLAVEGVLNSGSYRVSARPAAADDFPEALGRHGTVVVNATPLAESEEEAAYRLWADGQVEHQLYGRRNTTEQKLDIPVASATATSGEIENAGDRDWFAVELEAGKEYQIDLMGVSTRDGTLMNPKLYGLRDSEGNRIDGTSDDNGGFRDNSRVLFTPDEGGTYYIGVEAHGDGTGTYTVAVTETETFTDDQSGGRETALTVAVDGLATGTIELPGDQDWLAVTLEANVLYRIDLKGDTTGDGTLRDPKLYGVYDSNGNSKGIWNDDGDRNAWTFLNSYAFFEPDADGTYYIRAGAYMHWTGTYKVQVTEIVDDFAADTSTMGTVAVGGTAMGEIETRGDRDWFAAELEAGTRYRVDVMGRGTRNGTLEDPVLRGIHDSEGAQIPGTSNDVLVEYPWNPEDYDARVFFTPDEAGTYYIATSGSMYSGGSHLGTYTVAVTEDPVDAI